MGSWSGVRVYTVGHSTRTLDELSTLLRSSGVATLVDIRTVPRSRHNPQFNRDTLPAALRRRGLRYVHLSALGGLRRARKDSSNIGWRNASFRGFADYMQTPEFEEGLTELRGLAAEGPIALMCAEAVPWRCHRSLVADALTIRGASVEHIIGSGRSNPHRVTSFAKVEDERITYPGTELEGGRLPTRGPFHLEATVRVLQRRPTNLVDVWDEDRYLRVLDSGDDLALIEVSNRGTIDDPDVRMSNLHGDDGAAARSARGHVVRTILGLDIDPAPLEHLAEAEGNLHRTATALRGMRPPRFPALFEAFANVVPFQHVSLEAGVAVTGRLVERLGVSIEVDGRRFHAFPTAATVAEARLTTLRGAGLSAHKANALRHVARAIATGELTQETLASMSTDDALRMLVDLPGIGPWSAGLVLLRGLGRMDVFPTGDVGAARGLGALPRLDRGVPLERVVERFGDLRGYVYFLNLGSSLLAKGLIQASPPEARPEMSAISAPTRAGARRAAEEQPPRRASSVTPPRTRTRRLDRARALRGRRARGTGSSPRRRPSSQYRRDVRSR